MSRPDRTLSGQVAAEALATRTDVHLGKVLVAEHHPMLEQELSDLGAPPTVWDRFAFDGRPAKAWPASGPFDLSVARLPKGKQALRTLMHPIVPWVLVPHARARLKTGDLAGARELIEELELLYPDDAQVRGDVTALRQGLR